MIIDALAPALASAHWAGPWAAGWGWVFFLIPLFWFGLIFLIFSLFGRRWRRYGYGPGYPNGYGMGTASAEQTLSDRYARGDIDEVEYRARLEVLRANRPNG